MARGARAFRFAHFGRGLNVADGVFSLHEGFEDDPGGLGAEARSVLNVVSRHVGNVRRRDGCTVVATDAATKKDLSVIGNGSASFAVSSTTAGGLVATDADGVTTALTGDVFSTSAPWTFLRLPVIGAQGAAYGMNGIDTPQETDGTAAGTGNWTATSGTLQNGTLLEYHETTLWVAGVAATPYSLFWSAIGDPTSWPAENVTKFNPDGGLPITALRSTGSYLLVFKERGIWRVYDSETSANLKFADNVGTLSPKSVVATPVGCFFLDSQRGVHLTDGTSVTRISAQIQPLLDQIANADLPAVTAAYQNGHYYLSANFNGVQQILDYDTELNSWWVHSPAVTALGVWDRGLDADLVGVVGTDIWQLFKDGEITDPGGSYESFWSGPFHTFGSPHLRKRCNEIHIDARGVADVYVAKDYDGSTGSLEGQAVNFSVGGGGGTFGVTGTFGDSAGTFGGGGQVGEGWIYSPGIGRAWSLTFYSGVDKYWEVDAYTMSMTSRSD